MLLEDYRSKRRFASTPEPSGEGALPAPGGEPIFVVQKHHARQLHYDLRLEWGNVLRSWAVPKGPSLDPADKRLAVLVEEHPLDYASFEGTIPAGEYGAGKVIVWDRGVWRLADAATDREVAWTEGHLKLVLEGSKLRGRFMLLRARWGGEGRNWLLVKEKDAAARPGSRITEELPFSVITGHDVEAT